MIFRTLSILPLAISALAVVPPPQSALEPTVLDPSVSKDLLYLHRKLVETESISENEKDVGNWLAKYLRAHDWTVEKQEVSKDRYNLLAYGSKRETTIVLSSHIDTVPPYWPYYYNETTDIIGGRGSVDAKGSVAPMIIAAQGIKGHLQDDISLLFVVGEETGGDGMRAFSDWDKRPSSHEIVIFGEPTEAKLVCGHKGMLGFSVKAMGKAAHSGYPWLGVSANDIMVEALGELLKLRDHLPWSTKYGNTTMNFGRVQGGVAANVVAETATANIATRLAAGTPDLVRGQIIDALKNVKAAAQKEGGDLEVQWGSEGYGVVDINCDIEGFETMTVNYGTDVPWLSGDHKRYLYGPGSIFVAHSDHEALKRKELEQAVLDYRRLIIKATEVREKERQMQSEDQIEL
ncbi:putative carboxypeptidase [Alternaria tenuissima]|uniref:Carboxypeptidase n=1 Tax=Alternaria tenuissima TaxID=119927 RepID=A0ABY0GH22_9PLEO|nr:putative carboxypeptidase [Alternaria tenuissima]RYO03891.1 putative carboxypeptidase [Alternaria tenuissima]RYO16431.1 putative carboxypeptidase [Alternaria tenuissima]RYO57995.1 putative carboxypeptidase [Alternaria tenuissima]